MSGKGSQAIGSLSKHKSVVGSRDRSLLAEFYFRSKMKVLALQEDIQALYEPFYRSKNVGNIVGTGLGLAVVKK